MTPDTIEGLTLADAIRRGIEARGDRPAEVIAWLAEHGRPGVPPQRVYDVLRRDGRAVGKPRPAARPPGTVAARTTPAQAQRSARAEQARITQAWQAQGAPVPWRADAEGLADGEQCERCNGPMRWTGAGTMVVCVPCNRGRRSRRAAEQARDIAESWAPRQRRAARQHGPTRAERDQLSRQAHAAARHLGRIIAQARTLKGITPEGLDTLAWYEREAQRAEALGDQGDALGRIEQLTTDLADEHLPRRRWWQLPSTVGELATADLDAEQIEALAADLAEHLDQQADAAEAEGRTAPRPSPGEVAAWLREQIEGLRAAPRPAIEAPVIASPSVLCEQCLAAGRQAGAVARIWSPEAPWAVPERDACLDHYREAARLIEGMTYVSLAVLKSYAVGAPVRSIPAAAQRAPSIRPAIMGEVIR